MKKMFLKKTVSLLLFLSLFIACHNSMDTPSQKRENIPWNESLSTEQNIAQNAIPLQESTDFSFLDNIVKNKKVIILGEKGHYNQSTAEVQLKMIDYLKAKGFSTIALEMTPFLSAYIFSNPDYKESTQDWNINEYIALTGTPEYRSVGYFKQLIEKDQIKLWGIDTRLGQQDIVCVKNILKKYGYDQSLNIDWNKLSHLFMRKFIIYKGYPNYNPLNVSEQYEMMRMIDSISNYTYYLFTLYGKTNDLKALLQWIRNINTAFSYIEYVDETDEQKTVLPYRNRDSQMAENILWMVENFPEEKFIVWTASFHGALDISQTKYPADSLLYFNMQTMGEILQSKLGGQLYSLAITPLPKKDSVTGDLEKAVCDITGDVPFAFIDFESLRHLPGYRDKELDSEIIANKKPGKFLYIFDGVYYIK